jgi:hypothetical protein
MVKTGLGWYSREKMVMMAFVELVVVAVHWFGKHDEEDDEQS